MATERQIPLKSVGTNIHRFNTPVNIWLEIVAGGGGFDPPDTQQGTLELLERWSQCPQCGPIMAMAAVHCAREQFNVQVAADRLVAVVSGEAVSVAGTQRSCWISLQLRLVRHFLAHHAER
jgi:hypothetical protein